MEVGQVGTYCGSDCGVETTKCEREHAPVASAFWRSLRGSETAQEHSASVARQTDSREYPDG